MSIYDTNIRTYVEQKPQITVLMSVYNCAEFVKIAIDSILQQSFSDFEFIIIDDCSTDNSREIINCFKDKRIRLVCNDSNIGLSGSLNKGILLSNGRYIARMDADDISYYNRLKVQFEFMERHPDIGVCGTWLKTFGDKNIEWRYPVESDPIKCCLLFESPFAHPTVMIRRDTLIKNKILYDASNQITEDYDFWVRLSNITNFANIPEVLYSYRLHQRQAGCVRASEQRTASRKIRYAILKSMVGDLSYEEQLLHELICDRNYEISREFVQQAEDWLIKLLRFNMESRIFPEPCFNKTLANRWFDICRTSTTLKFWILKKYYKSSLKNHFLFIMHNLSQTH